jgi:non-ribosomal peptide synthetase component E (peptide arylation enzyme)
MTVPTADAARLYSCRVGCKTSISRRNSTSVVFDDAVTIRSRRESRRAARITHFKVPTSVDFVTDLPRAATGKLQKHRLIGRHTPAPQS